LLIGNVILSIFARVNRVKINSQFSKALIKILALVADSDSNHSDTLFNATVMSENEEVNNKILSCLSIQRVSH